MASVGVRAWVDTTIANKRYSAKSRAMLVNIRDEVRMPAAVTSLLWTRLARQRRSVGKVSLAKAICVAAEQTAPAQRFLLGANVPDTVEELFHFCSEAKLDHYIADKDVNRNQPFDHPKKPLGNLGKLLHSEGAGVFTWVSVWLTFTPDGDSDKFKGLDPTRAAVELGLDENDGKRLYRVPVNRSGLTGLATPSAFDADFRPAWAVPPASHTHPWGLTRDLETGARPWPEVILPGQSLQGANLRAERVGDEPVGPIEFDYLAGRSL